VPDQKGSPSTPKTSESGRSGSAPGPDSYRYRYREKPDADRASPLKLAAITRTVVLASIAFGAILLYLVRDLGMDGGELLEYAKSALVFIGTFLVGGIVLGALIVIVRRLISRPAAPNRFSAAQSEHDPDVEQRRSRNPD